jgi:hypothetical protein
MASGDDPRREAVRRAAMLSRVVRLGRRRRADKPAATEPREEDGPRIEALEERVNHLEALLEGLQDAVHRESVRQGGRIGELEKRTAPATTSRTHSRDPRKRGV